MFKLLQALHSSVTADQRLDRFNTIGAITAAIINVMFAAATSISLICFVLACIQYLFNEGDPKRLETAWRAFFWSAISGLIAIAALGIKAAIANMYGVNAPDVTNNVPGF